MDPLSDVLSLLKLQSYMSGGFDAGGDWSIAFGAHDGIKVYAAVSGECWLVVDGVREPVRVRAGDCFLLPRGRAFSVTSDLSLTPVDIYSIVSGPKDGRIINYKGGGDFLSVGGHFALSGDYARELLGLLPPIVHIRNEADRAELRRCIEGMRQELRNPRPGSFLIAQQLATMMLVLALRLHLAGGAPGGVGWLFALADKQMAAALTAMHDDPAARWTLQTLADRAGMSRTSFATRFKEAVGVPPMDYLTRWRMTVAADRLLTTRAPVSTIALSLGYESESAFSTAFRRVMACSPRQYGRAGGLTPRADPADWSGSQTPA
jgi:AraC-like DNA-binding protein